MSDWGELQVDQLRFMAREHPHAPAYRNLDADTGITFAEWDCASNALGRGLAGLGVTKGDRVSVYLPSDEVLRWIVAYAAVHKAGAVAVPTNTRLSEPELAAILGHAEASVVLTNDALLPAVETIRDQVPSMRTVVSDEAAPGVEAWDAVHEEDPSDFQVPVTVGDLADVMYTSGTTGLPKGIAVRHSNLAMIPNLEPVWTGDGWIHGAPMFTFAGIAFIYNPMKMGLVGLYQPRFDAARWLEYVERERPTFAMLVPSFAELIVAHPDFARRDLSSLVQVSIGSAPLAPGTQLALIERIPNATVGNSYGMTEAGPAYIVMPKEEVRNRIGSVGKPFGPMEIKVVDDDGRDLRAREVGELLLRMAGKQREYYKNDEATASTWTEDGWLRSGDLAYLDEDGFLYICGRKKDMIIRGGNNVYATDVEAVLLEHPDVQEAAVTGVPHPVLGEDVAAWVVSRPDRTINTDQVLGFVAERLADYKRPRQLFVVDELPRNATGKVMKHRLEVPSPS